MPIDEIEFEAEDLMEKAVEHLRNEMKTIRTGRASPGLVEHLRVPVEAYGSTMDLRELASISVPEANMLLVKPFDPSVMKDIERAIQSSDIGITPMGDGKVIRLPVPALSGERRQKMLAQVRKLGEAQKIAVRNIRRDANKKIDAEKEDGLSEDEAEKGKENVQELTKKYETQIETLIASKSKELEEV